MGKKVIAMMLALAMTMSLAACGEGGTSSTASKSEGKSSAASTASGAESSAVSSGTTTGTGWSSSADVGEDAAAGKTDDRAFSKFDEPVEVHFARQINPADTTLAEGEDAANNQYTRYLEDTFNIKWVCDWSAGSTADYQQKISLQIAAGDLPDALVVPNRSYMVKAAEAGLLADMHDPFNDYASKQVKQIMETTDGRAYDNCTYQDVFSALPNVSVETDGIYVYFIRQDWLDKEGMEVPKTISELEAAAKTFKEKGLSPKYSIAGVGQGVRSYANFLESGNKNMGFDAVYQAKDAYPGFFIKDDADKVIYGTNTQESRDTLEILAKWYADGLINPELGISTNGDEAAGVKDGSCGIFMGPWWAMGYGNGDSYKNDPKADWQAYPLYTDDGKWNVKIKDVGSSYTIVSSEASDDVKKAIVIANNALVRDESIMDTSVAIDWWPLRNTMAAMDECDYEYNELYKVMKGETTAEDYDIPGNLYKNLYNDAKTLPEVISKDYDPSKQLHVTDMDVMTNNGQFNRFTALLIGNRPNATVKRDKEVESALYYTIDVFDQYWTQLQDLEDQTVMSIITGKADISAFDTYVENWNAQGGEEILAGVEEFLANS